MSWASVSSNNLLSDHANSRTRIYDRRRRTFHPPHESHHASDFSVMGFYFSLYSSGFPPLQIIEYVQFTIVFAVTTSLHISLMLFRTLNGKSYGIKTYIYIKIFNYNFQFFMFVIQILILNL